LDHAIEGLKEHMRATIEVYRDYSREDIEEEVKAYVEAINVLEYYYYGEKKTSLDDVLAHFK
jgi:hypothetical protein